MAKFIKSIFSPSVPEKQKNVREHTEHEGEGDNPIGDRRKLSMSRSGRLRHANKIRQQLSSELYGQDDEMQHPEKPKSMEYHVHPTSTSKEPSEARRKSIEAVASTRNGSKSPEEEIDSAFEIIDKS